MNTTIFIPKKIKVGFQERSDTYTKKLAYVIYYDQKETLRKEASWQSWRDKKIDPLDFENVPTSGFVLNKKVGGYSTGWNHRQTYVRVYDPRNFEFEISVPNLLYLLENTNSLKGKGLEGEFVYGWDGTELVLVPTSSPDYEEIEKFNKIVYENDYLKQSDLKVGHIYKNLKQVEFIYMGKFDFWNYSGKNTGKKYFFYCKSDWGDYYSLETMKSVSSKFISSVGDECSENYLGLVDELEKCQHYSPVDNSKDEYIPYTADELSDTLKKHSTSYFYFKTNTGYEERHAWKNQNDEIEMYGSKNEPYRYGIWGRSTNKYKSAEEAVKNNQPYYLNTYLANGKLYRRSH